MKEEIVEENLCTDECNHPEREMTVGEAEIAKLLDEAFEEA